MTLAHVYMLFIVSRPGGLHAALHAAAAHVPADDQVRGGAWLAVRVAVVSPSWRRVLCWPSCRGSEDCLYMNIFTPRLDHLSTPAPVMVFIHGGNFKQVCVCHGRGYSLALASSAALCVNPANRSSRWFQGFIIDCVLWDRAMLAACCTTAL